MKPFYFLVFLFYTAISFVFIHLSLFYIPILFVFIIIPLIDAVLGIEKSNPSEDQYQRWKRPIVWAPLLYLYSFTHFGLIVFGLIKAQTLGSYSDLFLLSVSVGLYTGGLGITVAHELCHKKEVSHRLLANLLLSSVWYQHFAVEHVRGHHFNVSTPEDPASARLGENVYKFLIRSIVMSFIHAFKIDSTQVMGGVVVSLFFTASAWLIGENALIFFMIQAVVALVLLELVNYLEHYGLVRSKQPSGRYEKVTPLHSWNSSHKFSNFLLFNLQRHSDHHASAHLPFTVLKNHDQSPQLPSGYPGMILIALIPPLWFRVMHPKIKQWESQRSTSI